MASPWKTKISSHHTRGGGGGGGGGEGEELYIWGKPGGRGSCSIFHLYFEEETPLGDKAIRGKVLVF